ncbi:hypothetical protein AURDEDRAFT_169076 [Auricularia subglabra TFB-10046 SS5]|nr:hypothetical protein AURDEDRAFT_169076 [Auricularia subglabra TFB-10046 SS5]
MFASHFSLVTTRQDVENKWHVWRAYDIAMRQKVVWPKPPYIGEFDMNTFQTCLQDAAIDSGPVAQPAVAQLYWLFE